MFRRAQMSFSSWGHTLTLTSPRCALRSRSICVRDYPFASVHPMPTMKTAGWS